MGSTLGDRLAGVLPEGCHFTVHHMSTPPTSCSALYAAPPNETSEDTYCESHYLSVSIDSDGHRLQVFGIEVLIYSTEYLTTLFVSKADSTGYLHLLKLPSGTPSPLKIISSSFIGWFIDERRRSDRRLVLSLFARAQNQYLFPGSIDNSHKHVLDDRGLIKWWCKVVDRLLGSSKSDDEVLVSDGSTEQGANDKVKSQGFLRVPGCDAHETRTFFTKEERERRAEKRRWHTSDPLKDLGRPPSLPERCLIPRFPDDPKARFVEQLDDELPEEDFQLSQSQDPESPSKRDNTGRWRSVRSLEQFWDMMSFRQECSSGRLVGFLWATFEPVSQLYANETSSIERLSCETAAVALPTPEVSQDMGFASYPPQSPSRSSPPPELPSTPLKQTPMPFQQTPTPTPHKTKEAAIKSQPEETEHYYWPRSSRGEVILRQKDYQGVNNLLMHLDYATQEEAIDSTRKWINDVAERAGVKRWGQTVVGTVPIHTKLDATGVDLKPILLSAVLMRKKKRPADSVNGNAVEPTSEDRAAEINVLAEGMIRKKAKVTHITENAAKEILQINGSSTPA